MKKVRSGVIESAESTEAEDNEDDLAPTRRSEPEERTLSQYLDMLCTDVARQTGYKNGNRSKIALNLFHPHYFSSGS